MSKLFTSALFFISFAPLWLSVIFVDTVSLLEDTQSSGIEKIGISTILVVFSISLVFVLKKLRVEANSEAERYTILTVTEEKTVTSEFYFHIFYHCLHLTSHNGKALRCF